MRLVVHVLRVWGQVIRFSWSGRHPVLVVFLVLGAIGAVAAAFLAAAAPFVVYPFV